MSVDQSFLAASLAAGLSSRFFFSRLMRSSSKSKSYCYFDILFICVSKFFFSIAMSAIFTISIVFKVCSDSKSSSVLFYISSAAIYLSCYLMKFSLISIPPPTYLSKLTKATLFWCIRLSIHTKSDSVRCNLFINVCFVLKKHWLIFFWQMASSLVVMAISSRLSSSSVNNGSKGCLGMED